MSESIDTQTKPLSRRNISSDREALVQVEKWMAMIREIHEISEDRQSQLKLQS
jgi:hypothetical protein